MVSNRLDLKIPILIPLVFPPREYKDMSSAEHLHTLVFLILELDNPCMMLFKSGNDP